MITIQLTTAEILHLKEILHKSGADLDDIEYFVAKLEEVNN